MDNFFLQRREELGVSQRYIADILGITGAAVGAWERGESTPKAKDAEKIAKAYEVSESRMVKEIIEQSKELSAK